MKVYSPITREVLSSAFAYQPRSCFVMTQLGGETSNELREIRKVLSIQFSNRGITEIDAISITSGRDFLNKIWKQILADPMGIAILTKEMKSNTISNIYYELS